MNSVLEKYFSRKKSNLLTYISDIIAIFDYTPTVEINNKNKSIKKILNIYFEKYYKVLDIKFDVLEKYYKFDQETDLDFKIIIECIIEYYENENIPIASVNNNIIYFSYLIYFGFLIERLKDTIIIMPNKEDFIVSISNKVSPSFKCIKNDKFKTNVNKLINSIKIDIRDYNKLVNTIDKIRYYNSYNEYISINDNESLYKIKYKYKLDDVKKFKESDVRKVMSGRKIDGSFILISYELAQLTLLKCLLYEQRVIIVLKIDKKFYRKKSNITALLKLITNRYTSNYTRVIIDGNDYEECDELNKIKENNIVIMVDSNRLDDVKNINFDNKMVLITSNEFIVKYKEELDKRKIKYIKKSTERIYKEKDLFLTKVEFMEV